MSDPDAPEKLPDPGQDFGAESMDKIESDVPIPSCIQFVRKGPENNLLVAVVEPSFDFPAGIATNAIEGWIRKQDCDGWLLHEQTIWLLW